MLNLLKYAVLACFTATVLHGAMITSGTITLAGFTQNDTAGDSYSLSISNGLHIAGTDYRMGVSYACTLIDPSATAQDCSFYGIRGTSPGYDDYGNGPEADIYAFLLVTPSYSVTPTAGVHNQVFQVPFTATGNLSGNTHMGQVACELPGTTDRNPCATTLSGYGIETFNIDFRVSDNSHVTYFLQSETLTFAPEPSEGIVFLIGVPLFLLVSRYRRISAANSAAVARAERAFSS